MRCEFCTQAEPYGPLRVFCPIFIHIFTLNPTRECSVSIKKRSNEILKLENVSYHHAPMSGKATVTVEELDDNSKYSCEVIVVDQNDQTELVRMFLTPEQRIALASHLAYLPDQAKMNFNEMVKEVKDLEA